MTAGFAVMDGALIGGPAPLAAIVIARQNGFPAAAEAPARVGSPPVAAAAKAGDRGVGATPAEQRRLDGFPQKTSITVEKIDYH